MVCLVEFNIGEFCDIAKTMRILFILRGLDYPSVVGCGFNVNTSLH